MSAWLRRAQMTRPRPRARFSRFALAMFLLLAALDAHPAQQAQRNMPPRTQDLPLRDRIEAFERVERESWQKPDEVVAALGLAWRRSLPRGTDERYGFRTGRARAISDVTFPSLAALEECARSAEGKEALAHAASISSGGPPTILVMTDDL